ncbi:MAG: NFACT RNA binding domain-containing protein [Clostridiales bacterium]|nr:NFACT RNA binding domain-containing protein [Clostridiales bacterium]
MPIDAVFLESLRCELQQQLLACRVDKVQQPERDTILLSMRGPNGGGKLLLTASPNHPRIHPTRLSFENPAQPPMFCKLLRKHLTGGRLVSISQPPLERLVELTFDCIDEMGTPCRKKLILEIMGRNSNLILTGADGRILDCLRRVDFEMSEQRQVLPGLYYHLPPAQGKRSPWDASEQDLLALLGAQKTQKMADSFLLETFGGLSPLLCRELAYAVFGQVDLDLSQLTDAQREDAAGKLFDAFDQLHTGKRTPVILVRDERPWDFTCIPIRQYEGLIAQEPQPSFSALLDTFYAKRDSLERMRQKTQALRKTLTNLHNRTARKLANQQKELEATFDREHLRRLGDIVTANLHVISRGQARLTAVDFYDPEMKEIDIPLNPAISPQQNAAKFYKDYQKAKTAEKVLTEQIAKGEAELSYLASVLDELSRVESERDMQDIRQELTEGGYLRETGQKKKMKLPASKPMVFRSSDGFEILVGRNNRQNDLLTCKLAQKQDIWLHTQKIHGSHVIIACAPETPPDRTVTEAMQLAVYFSQAREGQNVPVDYTRVKNVKKPAGAKPGMVIYDHYSTAVVTPDAALAEKLREG